jgi:hypothetical protein
LRYKKAALESGFFVDGQRLAHAAIFDTLWLMIFAEAFLVVVSVLSVVTLKEGHLRVTFVGDHVSTNTV